MLTSRIYPQRPQPQPAPVFPLLTKGARYGTVVLWSSPDHGVVVAAGKNPTWPLGAFAGRFNPENDLPFHGEVVLSS